MIRRLPVIPTILVVAAVATMVWLGFWQLGRAQERDQKKLSMIERPAMPTLSYPFADARNPEYLYRRLSAKCDSVLETSVKGAKDASGRTGWAHIAYCHNVEFDKTFFVQIGVAQRPDENVVWNGGDVEGIAVKEPDLRGLIERTFLRSPPRPAMIIADPPQVGLLSSMEPDPEAERNTSWAYAGQWFFFALTALIIYWFAVKSRLARKD